MVSPAPAPSISDMGWLPDCTPYAVLTDDATDCLEAISPTLQPGGSQDESYIKFDSDGHELPECPSDPDTQDEDDIMATESASPDASFHDIGFPQPAQVSNVGPSDHTSALTVTESDSQKQCIFEHPHPHLSLPSCESRKMKIGMEQGYR